MRTRFRATARRSTSPPPSTACCATSCSTRAACSRAPSCSSTSGSTTSAATPACSRPTSATCARSSTSTARRSSTPCAGSATRCAARARDVMVSLRARLLAGVLALTAVAMLLLGGITYAEQRSFLYQRLDQQTEQAPVLVAHELKDQNDPGDGDRPPGGGDGPPGLPSGTYGEQRDAAGEVVGTPVTLGDYGQGITAKPDLPAHVPVHQVFTVNGKGKGSPRYRVYALPDRGGAGI